MGDALSDRKQAGSLFYFRLRPVERCSGIGLTVEACKKSAAIVQAMVASWYPGTYQKFSSDVAKAKPYVIAIGTALETA
jgi:hypothetical protein